MSSRGIHRERQVRALLEADGWWVARAAGSLGDADLVALKHGEVPRLIECKSTHRGPWHSFGPADRDELISAAVKAGATPWLCWWPVRKPPMWFPASMWPPSTEREAA